MRKLLLTFVALSLVFAAWATDQKELTFKKSKNQFKVENVTEKGFSFELSVAKAYLANAKAEEGDFFTLQTKGFTKSFALGDPNLPVKSKLIELPFGADVKLKVVGQKSHTVDLSEEGFTGKLLPCQPSQAKCDDGKEPKFHFNEKVYQKNAFYANKLVKYEETGVLRGTRLGRIEVSPFEYNPATNELIVYTDLEVEVTFANADMAKTEQMKKVYGNTYTNQLLKRAVNHQQNAKPLNQTEPAKMMVIADRMFENSLQPFVDWKNMKGIETTVRYTDEAEVGSTTTSIQSFLQGVYDNATESDPAPSFVLLVGDIAQIPAYTGESDPGHVTDLYYFCYDGANDNIPDVNYGRFSAQSAAELDVIIEKTLLYDKYEMADPSYLDEVILVAGDDESWEDVHGNGAINYMHDNYMNEAHGINAHVFLQDPPNGNAAVSDSIIANVSSGVAWGNYTAHCGPTGWGTPSFTNSDIPGLTNDGKYGVLIGNCCLSNKFDEDECFGEALLRAENKGAIGYMGGSNSTYWDEDYWWAVGNGSPVENPNYEDFGNGCYDLMFHENATDQPYSDWTPTQSQINIAGNLAVEESSSTRKLYYWEIYHLMGDPSLMPYAGVPEEITPDYMATIPLGLNSIDISGIPPYARVALSNEGELIATEIANESGSLTLEFDAFTNPVMADLVITGQFHQPYIGTLEVIPGDEPFVTLNGYEISDVEGNNNGMADYNESIALNVNLKNVAESGSGYDAANVDVVLSTDDPFVTVTDSTESYGDVNAGDSVTVNDAFAFDIVNDVPDQHVVEFDLQITGEDAKYTWETSGSFKVNAPEFTIGSMVLSNDDDDNNRLDPGETATLTFEVLNAGKADANEVVNYLNGSSPYFSVQQKEIITNVNAQETKEVIYTVEASDGTPQGTPVDLTFSVYHSTDSATTTNNIIIGQPPEIEIGTGTEESGNYPFYTYYENNKTQMLYLGSEIGAGEMNIQEIAFDFQQLGGESEVQNLSIKFFETADTSLASSYLDDTDATEVFYAATYTMPTELGWHNFDIDDYLINLSDSNLVVQITWGDNGNWSSPAYKLKSTTTSFTSVVFGYADDETPPAYDDNSSVRPNMMLFFEGEAPGDEYIANFEVTDGTNPITDATVSIGEQAQEVDSTGSVEFSLYEGDYYYSASATGYIPVTNEPFTIGGADFNQTITLLPMEFYMVNFEVSADGEAAEGAVITCDAGTMTTDANGEAAMEMMVGDHPYTVSMDGYDDIQDTVSVVDGPVTETINMVGLSALDDDVFTLYPNPNNGTFQIKVNGTYNVSVMNTIGKVIHNQKVTDAATINLENAASGIYFIRVKDGDKVKTSRFIINR